MKKFLIAIIFVIPIVVVLALSVTSTIIVMTTPVNPTGIELRDSSNNILERGDIVKVDIRDTEEFIIVNILPNMTPSKEITYERDEEAGDGVVELEKVEGSTNRYRLLPKKMGVTKLIIRAKANINVYATVTVQVTADTIERITLYNGEGATIEGVYEITGKERLYYDIYPIDALSNNDAVWSSTFEEIAEVSKNGTVTPVSRGYGEIRVTAKDKDGNIHHAEITIDTNGAVANTDVVYVSDVTSITLDWIKSNVAVAPDETEVEYIGNDTYLLTSVVGGEQVNAEVKVVQCDESDWGVTDNPETIYTANGPYYTTIGYLVSGEDIESGVTYASSDNSIMTVSSYGELIPVKAGVVTLTVTFNGEYKQKEITVRERPVAFELEMQSADAKLGIQMTRKWGNYWFDENGALTSTFTFGILNDRNAFDIAWTVSTGENGEELVTLTPTGDGTQSVDITFLEAARGKSVTVTATLVVNKRPIANVRRSFTFNVIDEDAVNVYNWEQMRTVADMRDKQIVMQSDIFYNDTRLNIGLSASIYGNGFVFDYSSYVLAAGQDVQFIFQASGYAPIGGELLFEDLSITGAPSLEEAESTACMVQLRDIQTPVTFRYCQIYNTARGIQAHGLHNLIVEGCILGDNYNCSFELGYENIEDWINGQPFYATQCKVTFRNNVFKNTTGPSIQFIPRAINASNINQVLTPQVIVEGFMDTYNWVERDNLKNAFSAAFLTLVSERYLGGDARDLVTDMLSEIADSVINQPQNDSLFYSYNGKEYASPCMFVMGLMCYVDENAFTISEEAKMQKLVMNFRDENGDPIGNMAGVESVVNLFLKLPGITFTHPALFISSDYSNGREPDIKPGDPVPNDQALYDRLTSGAGGATE